MGALHWFFGVLYNSRHCRLNRAFVPFQWRNFEVTHPLLCFGSVKCLWNYQASSASATPNILNWTFFSIWEFSSIPCNIFTPHCFKWVSSQIRFPASDFPLIWHIAHLACFFSDCLWASKNFFIFNYSLKMGGSWLYFKTICYARSVFFSIEFSPPSICWLPLHRRLIRRVEQLRHHQSCWWVVLIWCQALN